MPVEPDSHLTETLPDASTKKKKQDENMMKYKMLGMKIKWEDDIKCLWYKSING